VANDEGLVEGDGDEPAEVAADEGVVERDGWRRSRLMAPFEDGGSPSTRGKFIA
jgi:hypothetical protein